MSLLNKLELKEFWLTRQKIKVEKIYNNFHNMLHKQECKIFWYTRRGNVFITDLKWSNLVVRQISLKPRTNEEKVYFKLNLLFFTDQDEDTSLLREEAWSKILTKAVWIQNHKLVSSIRR